MTILDKYFFVKLLLQNRIYKKLANIKLGANMRGNVATILKNVC